MSDGEEAAYFHHYDGSYCGFVYCGEYYDASGKHVGRLCSNVIVNKQGKYLGEVRRGRVLTQTDRKGTLAGTGFTRIPSISPPLVLAKLAAEALPAGFEEFSET
jgi:hypothetical protein